jgi:hypothetical protein
LVDFIFFFERLGAEGKEIIGGASVEVVFCEDTGDGFAPDPGCDREGEGEDSAGSRHEIISLVELRRA